MVFAHKINVYHSINVSVPETLHSALHYNKDVKYKNQLTKNNNNNTNIFD